MYSFGTDEYISRVVTQYSRMLLYLAYTRLHSTADAEDAVQEAFLRLITKKPNFRDEGHEKAWLIVTVSNLCKSALRSPWRRREDIDTMSEPPTVEDTIPDETLDAVMALPEDYKLPVYLYYYEGYQAAEIAEMLGVAPATVRSRLSRARQKLKLTLGGVYDHDA